MACNDRKIRKVRTSGWTQEDERRYCAQQRREVTDRRKQTVERQRMLDGMTPDERLVFLAGEEAERVLQEERVKARQEKYRAQAKEARAQAKEAREQLVDEARLTAGYLQSELAAAITWRDAYGRRDGEWLDDPVAAITTGHGFGEEVKRMAGIKLQVNLCLDCSNSMHYNGLSDVSVAAMRTMYLALDMAAKQLPAGSLTVNAWLWAQGEDGKGVQHLNMSWDGPVEVTVDDPLGPMRSLPRYHASWSGQATWIHPLLKALECWENGHGDPGAYRLDLIISDGVLDHPTDARKGDAIQDRRGGNLQSVVLNFLPLEEWADYRVPNRCVQYHADAKSLFGLLHQILGEWLVHVT